MNNIINGTELSVMQMLWRDGQTYDISEWIHNGVSVFSPIQFVQEFAYTGGLQSLSVPKTGIYLLEVWGAQGGDAAGFSWGDGSVYSPRYGGLGGYSTGQVMLSEAQVLYICIGGQGGSLEVNHAGVTSGGYNGGGNATQTFSQSRQCTGGGGCTHIGTFNSTLESNGSTTGLYIVAGGGGGTGSLYGGTYISNGGFGGGISGGDSTVSDRGIESCTGYAGTQTESGIIEMDGRLRGGFGYGGSTPAACAGGGGGGLWGGTGGNNYSGGGGGSGYIGGVIEGTGTTTGGINTGHGKAKITLVKRL